MIESPDNQIIELEKQSKLLSTTTVELVAAAKRLQSMNGAGDPLRFKLKQHLQKLKVDKNGVPRR